MTLSARQSLVHILFPLLAGAVIYAFFRRDDWIHAHLLPQGLPAVTLPRNWLSDIFIYNLPDFCWSYSFSSAIFIWDKKNGSVAARTPVLLLLFLVAAEGVQYFFPEHFTFDWLDIVAAVLALFLSYLANRR